MRSAIVEAAQPKLPLDEACRIVDLDSLDQTDMDAIAREVAQLRWSSQIAIGTSTRPIDPVFSPLLEALTLTLTSASEVGSPATCVKVSNIQKATARLKGAIAANPQAAMTLTCVLRQTAAAPTFDGLAAEAWAYSMLLGGNEFRRWREQRQTKSDVVARGFGVTSTREGGELAILLNRPERHNAFSFAMREELNDALAVAILDPSVERVSISGAGRSFCSGGDLGEFGTATDLVAAALVRISRAPWRSIDALRERVTVRIHGATIGAGIEMAAFAGQVSASPDTYIELPEVSMGLIPGAGGTVSIPRRIGRWRTAWLALSGSRLDAQTALEWGLVDDLDERSD